MLCSHDPIPLLKWSVGVPASEIGHRQRITDSGIAFPPVSQHGYCPDSTGQAGSLSRRQHLRRIKKALGNGQRGNEQDALGAT